jgi:ADP-ribose pyrophosphatase
MTFEEKTIESHVIYKGPIFTLRHHTVQAPGGRTAERDIIEHNGAVAMLARTPQGKLLLVRQYRKAAEAVLWEIPAGKIEPGETDRAEVARRELREETGYACGEMKFLTVFYGAIGYCSERIWLYECRVTEKGETDFDDDEAIDLYEVDLEEALKMVERGDIQDSKTIIAVLWAAREASEAK